MVSPKSSSAQSVPSQPAATPQLVGQTGVHYEIFVRSFADSNGDGIGDLNGVTNNLDYLHDLGISAIWLMPINPSPSYHKYDVTDYFGIDPEYGTLADCRRLVTEAHQRGIAVLIDLVLHHTSLQHPWFREAAKGPDNPYWSYYKWMHPDDIRARKLATRDITADSGERNPWHRVPDAPYAERYYGMFWSGMPDLNMDHEPLRQEISRIARFWLADVGIDGFRLDAARHLYREAEEPKNYQFWEAFRREVEAIKPTAHLVGEVWTRPERIAPYFRGLHANFNFDFALSLIEVVQQEDDTEDLIEFLAYVQSAYGRVNPRFIDALILSNHDQERVGSSLRGNLNHLRVAASLLLTLPGNPYLYYGEELGMHGKKPDESIREPFLWDTRPRDHQRTSWRRGRYSTSQTVQPLARQQVDPDSLFNHYRRLIHARNHHPVLNDNLSRLELSGIRQRGVIAFVRRSASGARVLIVHNLTGQPATVMFSPDENWCRTLVFSSANGATLTNDRVTAPGYSCVVVE